jgi:DNA adenine methylase
VFTEIRALRRASGSSRTAARNDPPYFRKAERLYPNYYSPKDHAKIAKVIQAKVKTPWIVSYDACDEIVALYSARRKFQYALQYNASKAYTGTELFIFSDKVAIPQMSSSPAVQTALAILSR